VTAHLQLINIIIIIVIIIIKTFLAEFWMDGVNLYRPNKHIVTLMNFCLPADKFVILATVHDKWQASLEVCVFFKIICKNEISQE
jgi:hypothetical protein